MKCLIDIVTKEKETDRAELNKLAPECETFLTSILLDHLFAESECFSHSYCSAMLLKNTMMEKKEICFVPSVILH